jgi:hypothetical protein
MVGILRGVDGECDNMQCIQEFLDMMPAGQFILILSTYLERGPVYCLIGGMLLKRTQFCGEAT